MFWRKRESAPDPPVSIVMPTLNQAPFVAESVRSVMSQGVGGLELIVADGGSTDDTLNLIAGLAAEFPGQVRWTSGPDGGAAQAVNGAVERARGRIIGWLNSDDLYTPGAVQRALAHLAREPRHVMVYGEAEHIDARGTPLRRYPTRRPETPLTTYTHGCHICQPSAFFRRDVFVELAGLDTSLRVAFDFEFWLRLLKKHAGEVGFIDEVQALSRLHSGAMTMRMRESVALEGLRVVHRHFGSAPPHWILTHFEELKASHPFQASPTRLTEQLGRLAEVSAAWLAPNDIGVLHAAISQDRAIHLSTAHTYVAVHADGWAGSPLEVRLRQPAQPVAAVRLHCRHASPGAGRLHLSIQTPDAAPLAQVVARPQPFIVELPVTDRRPDARLVFRVRCQDTFVPAEVIPGSDDGRHLAFMVESVEMVPSQG